MKSHYIQWTSMFVHLILQPNSGLPCTQCTMYCTQSNHIIQCTLCKTNIWTNQPNSKNVKDFIGFHLLAQSRSVTLMLNARKKRNIGNFYISQRLFKKNWKMNIYPHSLYFPKLIFFIFSRWYKHIDFNFGYN